jgi:hypothetical protein
MCGSWRLLLVRTFMTCWSGRGAIIVAYTINKCHSCNRPPASLLGSIAMIVVLCKANTWNKTESHVAWYKFRYVGWPGSGLSCLNLEHNGDDVGAEPLLLYTAVQSISGVSFKIFCIVMFHTLYPGHWLNCCLFTCILYVQNTKQQAYLYCFYNANRFQFRLI